MAPGICGIPGMYVSMNVSLHQRVGKRMKLTMPCETGTDKDSWSVGMMSNVWGKVGRVPKYYPLAS